MRPELRLGSHVLLALLLVACGSAEPPARGPRPLPPDSAAVLRKALARAQPAYATQGEALRAGVYGEGRLAQRASPAPPGSGGEAGHAAAYLIQLSAFRDRATADHAARQVQHQFPGRAVVIEAAGGVYRVAISGWSSAAAAEAELGDVRRLYADAWVRRRGTP